MERQRGFAHLVLLGVPLRQRGDGALRLAEEAPERRDPVRLARQRLPQPRVLRFQDLRLPRALSPCLFRGLAVLSVRVGQQPAVGAVVVLHELREVGERLRRPGEKAPCGERTSRERVAIERCPRAPSHLLTWSFSLNNWTNDALFRSMSLLRLWRDTTRRS